MGYGRMDKMSMMGGLCPIIIEKGVLSHVKRLDQALSGSGKCI